jgi:hypothetical protein
METLEYKKNTGEVLDRLRLLYENRAQDRIFAQFETPNKVLDEFNRKNPEGFRDYPDPQERIVFWDRLLKEKTNLEDDSLPLAYLSEFDQGLYGGLIGGNVQFMTHDNGWVSSMVAPILEKLSDISTLTVNESSIWFQIYESQMKIFAEGAEGKFGISHFILIDGLNFAFELVGATETYTALVDQPETVREVIDFAYELNSIVQQTYFDFNPLFDGGTFSNMAQWIPGRIVSESVDPFHMTSVDYFEKWGRENVEKIYSQFDGGVVHIHGNGRHLFNAVRSLKGLKAIYLGDDTGFPLAFDILGDIKKITGNIPLVVSTDFGAFTLALEKKKLQGGVFYKVAGAPDIDTANRVMEKVREYRI